MVRLGRLHLSAVASVLLTAGLACSIPGVGGGTDVIVVTATPEGGSVGVTPALATAAPINPADICPVPSGDTLSYISAEAGFCLLYPASYRVYTGEALPGLVVGFGGAPLDPTAMEPISVGIEVAYNGPAEGMTSLQYAQKWVELYGEGMVSAPVETMIGGVAAAVVANVPGYLSQRVGFVVINNARYTISLSPPPEDFPALSGEAAQTWETIIGSIVFFPPTVVLSRIGPEVCPSPTADTRLHIVEREGYCMLYPADFELEPTFSAGFVGGPVVAVLDTFGELRPELIFGWVGPAGGQTPRQAAEGVLSQADPASVVDVSVNGWPAVQYLYTAGPIPARSAHIVANDQVYTIVNQPYDPTLYPGAIPYLDRVWNTVTQSVTFFDVWR
jgi:hypothetical protein